MVKFVITYGSTGESFGLEFNPNESEYSVIPINLKTFQISFDANRL